MNYVENFYKLAIYLHLESKPWKQSGYFINSLHIKFKFWAPQGIWIWDAALIFAALSADTPKHFIKSKFIKES